MPRSATDTLRRLQERTFRTHAEEIAIGVLARRNWWRRVWISLLGVGLLVGAGLLYSLMQPPPAITAPDSIPLRVRCVKCAQVRDVRVAIGEALPLACPVCKERSCHELWACRDCNIEFLPDPGVEAQACPTCAGTRVGTARMP